ncbi:MAG: HAMP domain-containing protein [Deltaproteobacteria bacterium]|nr:HAMP domain-containing protein [Deltaproteobacteria bacterium]
MSPSLAFPDLTGLRSRLWPGRGIQLRLIALFLLATTVPLVLMGVILFSSSRAALREAVFRDALNNAKLASRLIDQYVGDARTALGVAARRPDLVEALQRQQAIPRVAIYRNLHESWGKFERLWDLDRQGIASVYYPADPRNIGRSFFDEEYFREPMRTGTPYVSDLSPGTSRDQPASLTVAAPIRGPDGRLHGVLVGRLKLAEITALLSRIDMGPGGYFYVVDRSTRMISHPRSEQIYRTIRQDNQLVRRALAGSSGVEERVNRWGVHMLTAYAPIPGFGWAIVAQIPAAVAYAPMQARSQELLLWVGGAIGLALLLGIVCSRLVARPLREVHEGVFKLARGEFHHQLPVRRRDEIGQLAEQFNAMAAALRNSYATLEAQVAERTRHLSAVYGIATTVSETLDLQEVLDRSLGRALEAMDAQGGYVCLYHEAGTCFRLAAHRGVTQEFVQAMQEIPMAETGAWEAPRAGALLMAEAQGGLLHPRERLTAQMGYQASLEVPLKSRHRFVGVMGLLFGEARRFPQTETGSSTRPSGRLPRPWPAGTKSSPRWSPSPGTSPWPWSRTSSCTDWWSRPPTS